MDSELDQTDTRRNAIEQAESETPADPRPDLRERLKSAQRFTMYLVVCDTGESREVDTESLTELGSIMARPTVAGISLLVEAVVSGSRVQSLGISRPGLVCVWITCTARVSVLATIAVLSYLNVIKGQSLALGKADWVIWCPTLVSTAGVAAIVFGTDAVVTSSAAASWTRAIYIAMTMYLTFLTLVVILCFTKLLVAILRVTQAVRVQEETQTGSFRRAAPCSSSPTRTTSHRSVPSSHHWLPHIHASIHSWSIPFQDSFSVTIGRSRQQPRPVPICSLDTVGIVTSARVLASNPADLALSTRNPDRDSPRARPVSSDSWVSQWTWPSVSEIERDPNEYGVGQIRLQDAWAGARPPGTGFSSNSGRVVLSSREACRAVLRVAGHLVSCVLLYVSKS